MEGFLKLFVAIGAIVFAAALIAIAAFLGGTIVYWIWPYTFPVLFPKAVASGIILAKLPWWTSVCLTWIMGILIKGGNSVPNIDKKD